MDWAAKVEPNAAHEAVDQATAAMLDASWKAEEKNKLLEKWNRREEGSRGRAGWSGDQQTRALPAENGEVEHMSHSQVEEKEAESN